jgi:hypothetical protein
MATDGVYAHYEAVLADLRARRKSVQIELQELDAAIGSIQRLTRSPAQPQLFEAAPTSAMAPADKARYSTISVRWGVLWHLAEFAGTNDKTGDIATALLAGGYQSDAAKFGNLVSAVLSNMKSKGEVEATEDGGYRLTETGRHTWAMIRQGAKFRDAMARVA